MTDSEEVERFIRDNEPIEQEEVVEEFGRRGLSALRTLMQKHRVSHTVDWKLQTETVE